MNRAIRRAQERAIITASRPAIRQLAVKTLKENAERGKFMREAVAAAKALEAGRNEKVDDLKEKEVRAGPRAA